MIDPKLINLALPTRSERVPDPRTGRRTVFVYRHAACGKETRVRASRFKGKVAVPEVGAIRCPHCGMDAQSIARGE